MQQVKDQILTQQFSEMKSKPQERYARAQLAMLRKKGDHLGLSSPNNTDRAVNFDENVD